MHYLSDAMITALFNSCRLLPATAIALALVLTVPRANAATFSIEGGHDALLLSNFDPTPTWSAAANDGIGEGATVTRFNHQNAASGGLFVSATGQVELTYTYLGSEAGYQNLFEAAFSFSSPALFDNKSSQVGDNQSFSGLGSGLVPLFFNSVTPGNKEAINGSFIDKAVKIAFAVVNNDQTAYAFLEDIAKNGDKDFDDMVIRIDVRDVPLTDDGPGAHTPLPAALPLFAGGLGVLALLARCKRRKFAVAAY